LATLIDFDPTGKSLHTFRRTSSILPRARTRISLRQKQKVRERIQADGPLDPDRLKNFAFVFPKIMICSAHPAAA